MGQTFGSLNDEDQQAVEQPASKELTISPDDLKSKFFADVRHTYQPIELLTLKTNLGLKELCVDTKIPKKQFLELIELPESCAFNETLWKFLHRLASYPLMDQNAEDDITVGEILAAESLLNPSKSTILLGDGYPMLDLLLLAFCDTVRAKPESITIKIKQDKVQWSQFEELRHTSRDLEIPASKLYAIIAFALFISRITLEQNSTIKLAKLFNFKSWNSYQNVAFDMLRSFDLTISKANYKTKSISLVKLRQLISKESPYLLNPIRYCLDSAFYDQKTRDKPFVPHIPTTKILTRDRQAQLAALISPDVVYKKLLKLFVASENGFSIRSLQNKIFKWNSPTIMLIRGRYIRKPETPASTSMNSSTSSSWSSAPKRSKLEDAFPKFYPVRKDSQGLPTNDDMGDRHRVLFMSYVKEPWRVTNKECFGSRDDFIAELASRQMAYRSSGLASNYVYFSTVGGGIGFGSRPPLVRGPITVYRPGEVSLTVDSGLEVANFRHLGVPGTFETGTCFTDEVPEYEFFFHVTEIEVWGLGSEKELSEQRKRWEWENREANARKHLNAGDWDESHALLEMAGIVGGNHGGGSV